MCPKTASKPDNTNTSSLENPAIRKRPSSEYLSVLHHLHDLYQIQNIVIFGIIMEYKSACKCSQWFSLKTNLMKTRLGCKGTRPGNLGQPYLNLIYDYELICLYETPSDLTD